MKKVGVALVTTLKMRSQRRILWEKPTRIQVDCIFNVVPMGRSPHWNNFYLDGTSSINLKHKIERSLPQHIGDITTASGPGMMELVQAKGRFPSPTVRFCTGELKIRPMLRYIRGQSSDVVNPLGIRAQESAKPSKDTEWEENPFLHCETWRPIIHWTEEDVIAMHHKHNVLPNPLCLKGAERVGCWPCIFARKREIRMLSRLSPDRIEEIRHLERHINIRRLQKDPDARPVSWFQRGGISMPIDQVVEWAHKSKGDRELFEVQDHQAGCMRWGLCDVAHPHMPEKPSA